MATGPNVTSVRPGDAVSCSLARYNDYSVFSERMLCKVPEASAEVAAVALSGLFGSMVVQSAADIKPGQTVFVTAGAGSTSAFQNCSCHMSFSLSPPPGCLHTARKVKR